MKKYILLTAGLIMSLASFAQAGQSYDILRQNLASSSEMVRESAAYALRDYIDFPRIEESLAQRAMDQTEATKVRMASVSSLAASKSLRAYEPLRRVFLEDAQFGELSVLALKSLYRLSFYHAEPRRFLESVLQSANLRDDVRGAAAWGLFKAARIDHGVQDLLMRIAQNSSSTESLRIEALKSLYTSVEQPRVLRVIEGFARALPSLSVETQQIILGLMMPVATRPSVRDFLSQVSELNGNGKTKAAAIASLKTRLTEAHLNLFHLDFYMPGNALERDPLQ